VLPLTEDVSEASDLGAHAAEFLLNLLIAAIDVIDAIKDGFAVGDEGGEDERGGGAKV
jgi:hypothetical protein